MFIESINPATGEPVGSVSVTSIQEIECAIARGKKILPDWRALSLDARRQYLAPLAVSLKENLDGLSSLLTDEMGKPLKDARSEVLGCANGLPSELDEMVESLSPTVLDDGRTKTTLYRDPLGVCAVITPWNFPLAMPHWMVIPALMSGNTVILKPSEETPLIAQAYADLLIEMLPEGVLQVIHGDEVQGKALVEGDVNLIAFTGSREAGADILSKAGSGLKRVILELGGKDPLIVLRDADIPSAARFAAQNSFRNAGQVCVSTERIYVDSDIADPFEKALVAQAAELKVGPGLEDEVDIGPMIHGRQKSHVLKQVRDAVSNGATLLFGGDEGEGNLLSPMVLTNVRQDMEIMREETFGPVACVATFSNVEEAIQLANDTPFGLGAVVFGQDEDRAYEVARQLDAGMVGVNRGVGGAAGSPWVGAKQSGFGFHSGREGHRHFTQARLVSVSKS